MNQGCLCVPSFLWEALLAQFGSLWMSALPWQLLLLRLETQVSPNSFLPAFMKSSVCNPFLACYRRYVFGSFWKPELNPRGGDHHKHLSRSLHSVGSHLWVSGMSAVRPLGLDSQWTSGSHIESPGPNATAAGSCPVWSGSAIGQKEFCLRSPWYMCTSCGP